MTERYFHAQLVNPLQGDPAVYVFIKNSGDAVLLDLGLVDALSTKDLLRVRYAFVSHTHIDHFVGFDRWLRVHVPHKRLLTITGPKPFFERVQAKLRSYIWNLIDPDQIRFQVYEIAKDGSVVTALLTNTDNFALQQPLALDQNALPLSDGSEVSWAVLDHNGIASISYKIASPDRLKIKQDELQGLGLKPGPWITELQHKVRQGRRSDTIVIDGKEWKVSALSDHLLEHCEGPSLVYCTDFSFSPPNIDALKTRFSAASDMVCETNYLEADRPRALAHAHLTTRQAALLSNLLGVDFHTVFHISSIYGAHPEQVVEEFEVFRAQFFACNEQELALEIQKELDAIELLKNH